MASISDLLPSLAAAWVELQAKCREAHLDVELGCTFRGEADQMAAFRSGASKAKYRESWHNLAPGRTAAFDILVVSSRRADGRPKTLDWDAKPFEAAGRIGEGLGLVWGGAWASLKDRPHFQAFAAGKPPEWMFGASVTVSQIDGLARMEMVARKAVQIPRVA